MSSAHQFNLNDENFPPEIMNTSLVTNRGGTYSSKSKNNSSLKPFGQSYKSSIISNIDKNSSGRFSDIILPVFDGVKQRQTISFVQDISEKTNKKAPTFK